MYLNDKGLLWIGFAIILLAVLIVYYPSFWHLLRGETYTYFLDTKGVTSASSLIVGWYDYEKVRIYAPGDRWLFKPLLFSIVGVEKALFGTHYTYWRVASLIMHLLACFSLYRLLWVIKRGWLAIATSLFFALMFTGTNAILYEQIASYTLFTALILTALYCVYTRKHLWASVLCLSLAPFINETGIIIAAVVCMYLVIEHYNRKWITVHTVLLPAYITIYLVEKLLNPAYGIFTELGRLITWETMSTGLLAVGLVVWNWGSQIVLPSLWTLVPQYRLSSYSMALVPTPPNLLFALNIVALLTVWTLSMYSSKRKGANTPFTLLVGSIFLVFTGVIAVFRAGTHGTGYVVNNSFNAYMFSAWFITLAYSAISVFHLNWRQFNCVAVAFVVLAIISGSGVYSANNDIKRSETPLRAYLARLDDFVSKYPDRTFSSTIASPLERDLEFELWKYTEPPNTESRTYTAPQILHPEHWSDNPDYILTYYPDTGRLEVVKQ